MIELLKLVSYQGSLVFQQPPDNRIIMDKINEVITYINAKQEIEEFYAAKISEMTADSLRRNGASEEQIESYLAGNSEILKEIYKM